VVKYFACLFFDLLLHSPGTSFSDIAFHSHVCVKYCINDVVYYCPAMRRTITAKM